MIFEFGIGKRYHAYHTRPTWNTGKIAAQTTAKIVIASAARLIDVRHFCRSRHRMAEISVPAWPMPIQKTKLTMSQAQLTGLAWPHTPTPVATRYVMPPTVNEAMKQATMKHAHHHAGVLPSMMPQILSVIHEKLRPCSTKVARGSTAGLTSRRIAGTATA